MRMQITGTTNRALAKQSSNDKMISSPNAFINGKAESSRTENPIITENAFILIPRPVPVIVFIVAEFQSPPLSCNSCFILQKI